MDWFDREWPCKKIYVRPIAHDEMKPALDTSRSDKLNRLGVIVSISRQKLPALSLGYQAKPVARLNQWIIIGPARMNLAQHDIAGNACQAFRKNRSAGACKRINNGDSGAHYFVCSRPPSSEPQGRRPQT